MLVKQNHPKTDRNEVNGNIMVTTNHFLECIQDYFLGQYISSVTRREALIKLTFGKETKMQITK